MTISEIYNKIKWILLINFRIEDQTNCYSADICNDLGLDSWDKNILIYLVESNFDVRFSYGVEKELTRMDQLVSLVYREESSKIQSINNLAS